MKFLGRGIVTITVHGVKFDPSTIGYKCLWLMADANKCFFNKIVQIPMPIVNIGLYKSKYESDL